MVNWVIEFLNKLHNQLTIYLIQPIMLISHLITHFPNQLINQSTNSHHSSPKPVFPE